MTIDEIQERLFKTVSPWALAAFAVVSVAGLHQITLWVKGRVQTDQARIVQLQKSLDQLYLAHEHFRSLAELKGHDVAQFKSGLGSLAKSRKELYETGLSLQEERRLLEKQLEIMTTSLIINPALQRVFLMRGEQPLQSYLISYIPVRAFGDVADTLPASVRIVSKERFAHPERGKSEEVNGKLQYEPPQVGTSVRSNALGEFVIFTNSKLILHGPPLNPEDHEKFPHICLGLDRQAALRLYRNTFIGTRIYINNPDRR